MCTNLKYALIGTALTVCVFVTFGAIVCMN